MKIMFSAGEASGDTHGASVAKALSQIDSNIEMFGMGGTLMEQAGVRIVYDIKNLGVIGIVEIIKSLPKFFKLRTYEQNELIRQSTYKPTDSLNDMVLPFIIHSAHLLY